MVVDGSWLWAGLVVEVRGCGLEVGTFQILCVFFVVASALVILIFHKIFGNSIKKCRHIM